MTDQSYAPMVALYLAMLAMTVTNSGATAHAH
jgi:hypothetical protein